MSNRTDPKGNKLPRGVCMDKDRSGYYRATYKGHSIRCPDLESAIQKRKELVAAGVPHPSYVARQKKKKKKYA